MGTTGGAAKACSCQRTRCQKNYCECFAAGTVCAPGTCKCRDCANTDPARFNAPAKTKKIKKARNRPRPEERREPKPPEGRDEEEPDPLEQSTGNLLNLQDVAHFNS